MNAKRIITAILLLALVCALTIIAPMGAFAEESAPKVSIERFNLSFNENIYIKYAVSFEGVDPSELDKGDVGMLFWTSPQERYEKDNAESISNDITYDSGVNYYIFAYTDLAAKQMTDDIYSRAYFILDGEIYYSDVEQYSILRYAYNKLGYSIGSTASTNQKLKDLLSSMLEYGAMAQNYFSYRTDHLANASFYDVNVEGGVIAETGMTSGLFVEGDKVTLTAPEANADGKEFSYWQNTTGKKMATTPSFELTVASKNEIYIPVYGKPLHSEGLEFTLNEDGESYSVTGIGTCTDTDIIIPETYNDFPVTSIVDEVFWKRTSIESIEIPDSVTSIGSCVFYSCTSITSIIYNGTVAEWQAITKGADWDYKTGEYTIFCTDGKVGKNGEVINDLKPESPLVVADLKFETDNEEFADGFSSYTKGDVVIKDGALKVENSCGAYYISDDNLVLNYENYESISFSMKFKFDNFPRENISLISPLFCNEELVNDDNPNGYIYQMFLKVNNDGELYFWSSKYKWVEPITFNGVPYSIKEGVTYNLIVEYNIEFGSYEMLLDGVTIASDSLTTVMDHEYMTGFDIRFLDDNRTIGTYSCSIESLKIIANGYGANTEPDPEPQEKVKVTFINEDGSVYKEEEIVKNEKILLPEARQLKAKKFEGWRPEGTEISLVAGMEYTVVKEMSFTATYSDVYPIEPVDFETNFVVPSGEMKTIYLNPCVMDTSKPIVINFKVAQKGQTKGHQNAILRINNRDTLKITSGYATFVLDDDPTNYQYPANGADTGWWGYKGDNYPNEKMQVRVTFNIPTNTIKFEVGKNINNPNYVATLNRIDISGDQIKLEFGYLITPELTITDFAIGYTTTDGVVVEPQRPLSELEYTLKDDGTYEVSGIVTCTDDEIIIPSTYEGKAVTSIGNWAFEDCTGLKKITILSSTVKIYDSSDTIYKGATIYGYAGSTAQAYAEKYDREFVEIKTSSGLEYTLKPDDTYEVSGMGTCTDTDIVIPSTYKGKAVTSIGSSAFCDWTNITNITIPESIKIIEDSAFFGCRNLTSVNIPCGVISVGDHAFYACSKITEITISDSVEIIGEAAFSCVNLTNIIVDTNNMNYKSIDGNLYTKDGKTLIQYASGKKETIFDVPEEIEHIGYGAFSSCEALTNINLSNNLASIGDNAFNNCSNLRYVIIPESLTKIGSRAFANCSGLTSITIPDSVTSIGEGAFSDCTRLTTVTFGENSKLTSIGMSAFGYCARLTSIEIPSGVTSIGDRAFFYCTGLTSIEIPSSVTSIGNWAFEDCTGLEKITILSSTVKIYDSSNTIYKGATIYGYAGSTAQAYANKYKRTFVVIE